MGIWDTLGKAVSKINDYAEETVEGVNKCKEKYARLNDKELMNESKKINTVHEKIAIAKLLGERGYKQDSDQKWRKR